MLKDGDMEEEQTIEIHGESPSGWQSPISLYLLVKVNIHIIKHHTLYPSILGLLLTKISSKTIKNTNSFVLC